jgi:hypothetical protein
VAKLAPSGEALAYATYLGGNGDDYGGQGIAVDGSGSAHVAGFTGSADFPTTAGAFDTTYNGGSYDAFVAKLSVPSLGYPRPKGATPTRFSLVPAYVDCVSPNREHGPPLAFESCNPPTQTSSNLTVGTPDANGAPAKSVGFLRLGVVVGTPGGVDDADVTFAVTVTDVRCKAGVATCAAANTAGGADYTGEIQATVELRITDRYNGVAPGGGTDAATGDKTFQVTVPCGATSTPTNIGSTCDLTTTADAVYGDPSIVKEGQRAIWQLGQVDVYDGGADGDVDTAAGNTLFATQGVFVP